MTTESTESSNGASEQREPIEVWFTRVAPEPRRAGCAFSGTQVWREDDLFGEVAPWRD